jgi:hypothetical protein
MYGSGNQNFGKYDAATAERNTQIQILLQIKHVHGPNRGVVLISDLNPEGSLQNYQALREMNTSVRLHWCYLEDGTIALNDNRA